MSDYKKTALVLGAGGFIGSHMVKQLRSEGYWVRGVDLKHPDFSETEANEFIVGDLREVDTVRKSIQFKGEQGNYYNSVPYEHIRPFDEIYQFAADMGGAGFIFTGENDADIMHNSASINLNLLEEVRKFNATFDGEMKKYTECNRPKLDQPTKIFYSSSANTVGRNSSVSGCISLIVGIMAFLLGLLATTISSDQKEPGRVEERKRQLQSAVKSLTSRSQVEQSKCGEMAYKLVPSCSLMNALKQLED